IIQVWRSMRLAARPEFFLRATQVKMRLINKTSKNCWPNLLKSGPAKPGDRHAFAACSRWPEKANCSGPSQELSRGQLSGSRADYTDLATIPSLFRLDLKKLLPSCPKT